MSFSQRAQTGRLGEDDFSEGASSSPDEEADAGAGFRFTDMASGLPGDLPTYTQANAEFQVQLVRKGNGTVVYMECDHDLLAQLSAFLHLPIGTLGAQLSPTAPALGLVKFGCSIAGLRDAVWDGKKQGMLPNNRPPASSAAVKLKTEAVPKCLCAAGVQSQQSNGYCNFCGNQFRAAVVRHRRQQRSQRALCQTCQVCEDCTQKIFQSARKGVELVEDPLALAVFFDKAPKLPQFKDTVKFLVDNELRVFENSSVKALQLLSAAQVNLADITTEERSVTKDEVNKLVADMLFNSKAILTGVFPAKK